jgi:hypothetical protein
MSFFKSPTVSSGLHLTRTAQLVSILRVYPKVLTFASQSVIGNDLNHGQRSWHGSRRSRRSLGCRHRLRLGRKSSPSRARCRRASGSFVPARVCILVIRPPWPLLAVPVPSFLPSIVFVIASGPVRVSARRAGTRTAAGGFRFAVRTRPAVASVLTVLVVPAAAAEGLPIVLVRQTMAHGCRWQRSKMQCAKADSPSLGLACKHSITNMQETKGGSSGTRRRRARQLSQQIGSPGPMPEAFEGSRQVERIRKTTRTSERDLYPMSNATRLAYVPTTFMPSL